VSFKAITVIAVMTGDLIGPILGVVVVMMVVMMCVNVNCECELCGEK